MSDTFIAGVVIAAAILIIKLVDFMISRAEKKELADFKNAISDAAKEMTKSLNSVSTAIKQDLGEVKGLMTQNLELSRKTWEVVGRVDEDGVPMSYVPRSWVSTQKEISKTCEAISRSQESLAKTQESCFKILEKMNEHMLMDQKPKA